MRGQQAAERRSVLFFCRSLTCLLVVSVSIAIASSNPLGAASPSPAEIGIQPSDVPGFSPVDPSELTLRDPADQGLDQAFIKCAGSTPLLSEFDTGVDATVGQLYGEGTNSYGTPTLAVGSAVFTNGNTDDAAAAFSKLSSSSFQQCWGSTYDSLNAQGGFPASVPTTVTSVPTQLYGVGTSSFAMNSNYGFRTQFLLQRFAMVRS